MSLVQGRINRRTFIAGGALSLFLTGAIVFFLMAPFVFIELVASWQNNAFINLLEKAFLIIPGGFLLFATFALVSRRAQDFGSNGTNWTLLLIGLVVANHFLSQMILSLATAAVLGFLCLKEGDKRRNNYGGKPPKKVHLPAVFRF